MLAGVGAVAAIAFRSAAFKVLVETLALFFVCDSDGYSFGFCFMSLFFS